MEWGLGIRVKDNLKTGVWLNFFCRAAEVTRRPFLLGIVDLEMRIGYCETAKDNLDMVIGRIMDVSP